MTLSARKICSACKETVAIKNCLFYNTVKHYVTIRGDDITTYVNYEDYTTAYKIHYCKNCWDLIVPRIEVSFDA